MCIIIIIIIKNELYFYLLLHLFFWKLKFLEETDPINVSKYLINVDN